MWSIIQHMAWEGPGIIAEVMAERGLPFQVHRMDLGEALPTSGVDGLVVMGGTMGLYEAARHPHLAHEIVLVGDALRRGTPVLGVCLGAQIMAAALGAGVTKGPVFEAGDGAVQLTPAGRADAVMSAAADLHGEVAVVHWHQDTFPLPDQATLLASTPLYAQQAFRFGPRAYAWQFHGEVTPAMAEDWRGHGLTLSDAHVMRAGIAGRKMLAAFFHAVS